ncbi:hypothetical protein K443DRAFT_663466 [Laccaria amethystina LaAM-08-1]|uniref:Histone H1 n=1 Tax=Laccaria amethystina LaAM-08-1 TaxID=1095629 RepID=A0A0C9YJ76_9AGAR|nr:hypothetical protein K443DRAFT_663466 [Laccaria amethystina LaAM-08-1]
MTSSTAQSPKASAAEPTSATKPASSSKAKKPATVKKTVTTKKPATVKKPATTEPVSKTKATAKAKATKAGSKATATRPSWKDIIKECIVLRKEDVRQGVSRNTIKKYAEETYKVEVTGTNLYQLNHAISTGAENGIFVLPKGPSGKVKLASTKATKAGGSKENSKPPSANVKKPVVVVVKKPALTTKKTLAGKKTTIASKRGAAKKAVTGNTKAKVAGKK